MNDAYKALTSAIGECIAAWNFVEDEISNLFMLLHGRRPYEYSDPLRAAFEVVVSLEARLQMVMATAEANDVTAPIYAGHCRSLCGKVLKKYKKRHEIAHFGLLWRGNGLDGKILARPFFKYKEFLSNSGRTELDSHIIIQRRDSFYNLRASIVSHVYHVGNLKGLPLEYYARAGDQVHDTQNLIVPIQKEPRSQHQSSPE